MFKCGVIPYFKGIHRQLLEISSHASKVFSYQGSYSPLKETMIIYGILVCNVVQWPLDFKKKSAINLNWKSESNIVHYLQTFSQILFHRHYSHTSLHIHICPSFANMFVTIHFSFPFVTCTHTHRYITLNTGLAVLWNSR